MKVLMIIPAYNEQENIEKTVDKVKNYSKTVDYDLDYIVINDGSTDKTFKVCQEKEIECINLIRNLGIGGAVQTGYIYAKIKKYDIAVQFDGDGQHDILSVNQLILPIINDSADFVIGSRFMNEGKSEFQSTVMRRVGIRYLSILLKALTGKNVKDPTSGFRAANRKVIDLFANEYPVDYPEPESIITLVRKLYRIVEVPANMFEREGGTSSIGGVWKSIYYMIKVSIAIVCTYFNRRSDG